MKSNMLKESISLRKPQYSSRIIVSPNSTNNKSGPTLTYGRRGNSSENYQPAEANSDNEVTGISGLITQSTRNGRPSTGNMNAVSFNANSGQVKYVILFY